MNNGKNNFKECVRIYLEGMAEKDEHLAERMKMESKSLDECCAYIFGEVMKMQRTGLCVAVSEEEVYGMAVHYYDEDDIKVEKNTVRSVVSPQDHRTDEEKLKDAKAAERRNSAPWIAKTEKKAKADKTATAMGMQLSLFDAL